MSVKVGIRLKIFLSFILLISLLSAALTISSFNRISNAMDKQIKKHGVDIIETFTNLAAPYIFENDYVTIRDIAQKLIQNKEICHFTILDSQGKVWLDTGHAEAPTQLAEPFYQAALSENTTKYRYSTDHNETTVQFVSPVSALGEVIYLVTMQMSLTSIEEETAKRSQEAIIICISMIISASLIAFYFSKKITQPINQLVRGTDEIIHNNFSYKIKENSSDEIGTLSRSFNLMTEQLKKESLTRKHAEKKIKEHGENLEATVAQRTSELRQTNHLLSEEVNRRIETADALKKSEERYKRLSEVTTEGIVLHNDERILDCNASFVNLLGYPLHELQKNKTLESILPQVVRRTVPAKQTGGTTSWETTVVRKDGITFPVRMQSLKVGAATDGVRVTSIFDITEQKMLEGQIRKAQRLESIGLMAGGVAHDLNNILAGITGYPELIMQMLPAESTLNKPIEAIQEAGERAAAVVDDLLTVARGVASVKEPHKLNTLVLEYFESPEFKKLTELYPKITCKHQLNAKQSTLQCSSVHIKKCLMNLVNNAAEAIAEQGTIEVSTFNRCLDEGIAAQYALKPGDYVVVKIQDSGPGISDHDLTHIFEPFYSKKVMGRSGTGLGLTIVSNTVEDHEGKVLVDSSDQGTSFQLYLPITTNTENPAKNDADKQNLKGSGERILVVDDEPLPRDIAAQMLQYHGYRIDTVSSGEEALLFIKQHPVDLVLLDMIMAPGMNGYETYKELIKLCPRQKAIIASGFSSGSDMEATLALGANGFIKKPYTIQKLGESVKKALQS